MHEDPKQEVALPLNLQDAGCTPTIIEQFLSNHEANNTMTQMRILATQRRRLLNNIHREQRKLDCLDYLLFQMKKKG